jgi:hypothetical protein
MNDYAGNGGLYTTPAYPWGEGRDGGVIRRCTLGRMTFAGLTDGLSNVLLAGEKRLDLLPLGQIQCDDSEGYTSGWDWDIVRWGNDPPQPDPRQADVCDLMFGSSHPAGMNALLGDGSVRVVRYAVDGEVFRRLCHRNDGQSISVEDL